MNLMYGFGISYKPGKARRGGGVNHSVLFGIHAYPQRKGPKGCKKAHSCMRMNAGGGVTFPKFCVRTE